MSENNNGENETAKQQKFVLSPSGVERLQQAFDGESMVPTLTDLSTSGQLLFTAAKERHLRSFLQISFLITRGENEVLLLERNKKNHTVTVKNSVMFSTKPSPRRPPANDHDIWALFEDKFPSKTLLSCQNIMRFLGVVRNVKKISDHENAHYYFYVFELRYPSGEETELEALLNGCTPEYLDSSEDQIKGWKLLAADLAAIVDVEHCAGDWAALHLLAEHRGLAHFADVRTKAMFRAASLCPLYNEYRNCYFVSHLDEEEETVLPPILKSLKKLQIKIWSQATDITGGYDWEKVNGSALWHCRGLIVVETPRSLCNEHIAEEVAMAIQRRKQCLGDYKIIRIAPQRYKTEQFDAFCSLVLKYLKKRTGDGSFNESDIEVYRNATLKSYRKTERLVEFLRRTCVRDSEEADKKVKR